MSNDLSPGFLDPVAGSQACFRAVLDAMARPGQLHLVGGVTAPAPLCDAAAAVVLTLIDHETPLWLDPAAGRALGWIGFHTGAPVTPGADRAMFVLTFDLPDLASLTAGTDEAPETSATVILQVASLRHGRGYSLAGPGLRTPAMLTVDGLPADFASIWQRNHARFPRGIDLILCSADQLVALPRSVAVREA